MIAQLEDLDQNAEQLYARLLEAVSVTFDRDTGEIVWDEAGTRLLRFGLPDLLFRLECQRDREAKAGTGQDAVARAKIWRHVAEACKSGAQIADLTDPSQLNHWLPDSHTKFTMAPPPRNCDSCGLPWEVCELHYDRNGGQQIDATKAWLCDWCLRQPEVRRRCKLQSSQRGACRSCGVPWEAVGVGGHVPVTGSDDEWTCDDCLRTGGKLVELRDRPSRRKMRRTCPCGKSFYATRSDAKHCSDRCRNKASYRKGHRGNPSGLIDTLSQKVTLDLTESTELTRPIFGQSPSTGQVRLP